jgi:hypothetical protein
VSRRREPMGADFGQVILQCPHGHPLGAIVRPNEREELTEETALLHLSQRIQPPRYPAKRLIVPRKYGINHVEHRVLPAGQKISLDCQACREAGRRPDYQASWAKVIELLRIDMADDSWGHVLTLR